MPFLNSTFFVFFCELKGGCSDGQARVADLFVPSELALFSTFSIFGCIALELQRPFACPQRVDCAGRVREMAGHSVGWRVTAGIFEPLWGGFPGFLHKGRAGNHCERNPLELFLEFSIFCLLLKSTKGEIAKFCMNSFLHFYQEFQGFFSLRNMSQ